MLSLFFPIFTLYFFKFLVYDTVMEKVRPFIFSCIFLLFTVFILWLSFFLQADIKTSSSFTDSAFMISHQSGFYSHSLHISITPMQNASIYYTMDGSEPSSTSSSSILYESPIALKAAFQEKSYPLRFRLYFDDGTSSKVYSYSYILGTFIHSRYDTYVVNILGNPDALFDEENGVFTAAYHLTGEESERPVNFQIFDKKGNLLTSQDCGLRIFGNFSRGKAQKSFQLFARKIYDVYGKFHLSLFPDVRKEADSTISERSNRLVFRNSGNDFGKAFLRDTLIQQLATDYGFPLTTPYVPAAVYINGEYVGFYWIKEPFSDGQMEELYGSANGYFERITLQEFYQTAGEAGQEIEEKEIENEEIEVEEIKAEKIEVEGINAEETEDEEIKDEKTEDEEIKDKETEDGEIEVEETNVIKDYQSIYDTYAEADLTDEKIFQKLCSRIDLDNYLAYYAMEVYIANKDWPYNNVRAFRYFANDGKYTDGTVFDGRYRYLFFDTDYGFGLSDDVPGYACEEDNIAILLNNEQSPLFCNLMTRADCREKFTNYVCDLMNGPFSYEAVSDAVQKLTPDRDTELSYYVENLLSGITTMDTVQAETNAILTFAQNRPDYMHTFLQKDYALFYPYFLHVESPESARISVNSIKDVGGSFSGIYYADNALTLKASANEGHRLAYWLINGVKYKEAELTFSSEEVKQLLDIPPQDVNAPALPENFGSLGYAKSEEHPKLNITLVVEDEPNARPIISRIHSEGTNDLVELSNISEHELSLEGLYLSDDAADLKKTKLPAKILASGDVLTFYGKKNKQAGRAGIFPLDFNLRNYETLYLSDERGIILEEIPIPDMGREDSDYVRDLFSGTFYEAVPK